ncbi:MAG: hypothetical protein LBV50_03700 [Novosphingobium sp.]|nr:hypothetical protein [Novosphingobium sp.]
MAAEPLHGFWIGRGDDTSSDGPELFLMVSDFSPDEFSVLTMYCLPGQRTVTFVNDTEKAARPRKAVIPLLLDGRRFDLAGKAEWNETEDVWLIEATVPYASPAVAALRRARQVGVDRYSYTRVLPGAQWAPSLAIWDKACGF